MCTEGDLDNFLGNEAADFAAKKSANRYGHPPGICVAAEAAQAAAIAKKEAAKRAAESDGYTTVGKGGKPAAS